MPAASCKRLMFNQLTCDHQALLPLHSTFGHCFCRVEAITLEEDLGELDDMNNMLVAPPTHMPHGQHILSLTQRLAFTPATGTQADEEDGMFAVPAISMRADTGKASDPASE